MEVVEVNCLQSAEEKGLFPVADGALPAQQEGEESVKAEVCAGLFPPAKYILRLDIAEGLTATVVEDVNCQQSVEVKGLFPVADGTLPAQQEGEESVKVEVCTGLFPVAKYILRLDIAEGPTATEVEEVNCPQSVEVN